MVIGIFLILVAFLGMEGVAWLTHKYIMHGVMWNWHQDHHNKPKGFFEKNDLFSVFFSFFSMGLVVIGSLIETLWPLFYLGLGVVAYGIAYFVFHDVIVHKRYRHNWKFNSRYMRKIIRVHKEHHKNIGREGGEAFGFLYAGKRYRHLIK
ncbi:MAG: sterol desaturase family protein [Bacteroidia bacterium]